MVDEVDEVDGRMQMAQHTRHSPSGRSPSAPGAQSSRLKTQDSGLLRRRPAIRMVWESLLFVHWPVGAETLRSLVPAGLDLDTFDGSAWVGLVPFTMPRVRSTRLPPIPTMHRFHECNVRTYVRCGNDAGVYFFSLDAASRLAVWAARLMWRLNYHHAGIELQREGDVVRYRVDRRAGSSARLRCVWRAGAERPRAAPGTLDHFLTERYCLFTTDRRGRPLIGRIRHEPWSLRDAELLELEDGLVAAAGIRVPDEPPVLYHADRLEVAAWPLERA